MPTRQPLSRLRSAALCTLWCCSLAGTAVQATPRIEVMFDDPGALYSAWYGDLSRATLAAGNLWLASFADLAGNADLAVRIGFAPIATATGRSTSAAWLGTASDGMRLYEQGAAHELLTGVDSNGAAADIEFIIGTQGYLQGELWFDPSPALRLQDVPADRTDAVSVLLHEFGHALGFNGWRDGLTGALPGNYQSTFDALVRTQPTAGGGTGLVFTGARAQSLYGSALPLTVDNYGHLGNDSTDAGRELTPDLMNGWVFYRGSRYEISPLDLQIMADLGMTLAVTAPVPEPATRALWLAGLCMGLAVHVQQQRRRSAALQA